jgi:hypothetical protein
MIGAVHHAITVLSSRAGLKVDQGQCPEVDSTDALGTRLY